MARKISIVNNKGGVGKTTTAVNLAASLAQMGKRVLLVDFDPQGSASHFLDLVQEVEEDVGLYTAADLLKGKPFTPKRNQVLKGLDLLPATARLSFLEGEMLGGDLRTQALRLSEALKPVESDYDYIIADSLPHLGILAVNAMAACPEVIVPVKLDKASLPGTLRMSDYIASLSQTVSPEIRLLGVLATFFAESANKPREVLDDLRGIFNDKLFQVIVHQGRAAADAAGVGRPIVLLKPADRVAQEYAAFAQEVVSRE